MSLVGQPVHAPHELPLEAVARILWLRRRLLFWFARNARSFPWREPGRSPYEVVVAEILLQRTTAAGVAGAYSGFVERYRKARRPGCPECPLRAGCEYAISR
jgi:adenine-specific DNA glycosylase